MDSTLVRDVDLLCLDAGNTVIFFDHARVAAFCRARGFDVATAALLRTEGDAKIAQEDGTCVEVTWDEMDRPGAAGWGRVLGTMIARAGVPERAIRSILEPLWREHVRWNTYSLVPPGLGEALDELRATGARVAIVSNSEGMLEKLFADLGILRHFDIVVDSGIVGVLKPDPRIFDIALERAGAARERALMLGDTFATDIVGARAAGIRAALIDPHRHLDGRHADVPRVPGVPEVARAIAEERRRVVT